MKKTDIKKLLAAAAALGFLFIWGACQFGTDPTGDTFDIEGDTTWTSCDKILIELLDKDSNVVDTLFNDSLKNIDDLRHLPADKFKGGKAIIHIKGEKGGSPCVEQNRSFDADGGPVKVDTVADAGAGILSLDAKPDDTLEVSLGGSYEVQATIKPLYANQGVQWLLADDTVAAVQDLGGVPAKAKVTGVRLGVTYLTARSWKDTSKSDVITVKVVSASTRTMTLSKDVLKLYQGGPADSLSAVVKPADASQSVTWKTQDTSVARVDSAGRITPVKAGQTVVTATSVSSTLSASALVQVKVDAPKLTVDSKSGAPVNVSIVFQPRSIQEFGAIVLYAWDLDGDGNWDSTLTGPFGGDTVDLPAVAHKYPQEGTVKAKFLVKDGEGNEATAEVTLDIGNQAPEFLSVRADTVISIKDSIAMTAKVHDVDGKVAFVAWDYDGDGLFDDSIAVGDSVATVARGHRYIDAGNYKAVVRAVDDAGKGRNDTVHVKVELDPPTADAGPDTTVLVNSKVKISAKGSDKFGTIAKRELKVGSGSFVTLSSQDTVIQAPAVDTTFTIVVRVTDDDGQTAKDSALVHVVLSANADLANLSFSGGALDPSFKPGILSYSARAAFKDSSVTVTPTVKDSGSHVTVNAKAVASGAASEAVKLKVGTNNVAFKIVVTAADGTQRTYTVDVARDPSAEATLSKLEANGFALHPSFAPAVLDYADTVAYADSVVQIKPTVAFTGATVAVNDSGLTSGTYTEPLHLAVGDNEFHVTVTAQDGISKTNYTVKVNRLARLLVYRQVGNAAATLGDSAEIPLHSTRSVSSPGATGYHFAGWTLTAGSAKIADSTVNPTDFTVESGVVKAKGRFEINTYDITGTSTGCGSINPPGKVTLSHGDSLKYTLTPTAGCRIASVKVDGQEDPSAYDGDFTFKNVTATHTFAAVFVRTYVVTVKADNGGTVAPGTVTLDSGTTKAFAITPNANWRVSLFRIDGADQPVDLNPTFDKISANHTLEVSFARVFAISGRVGLGAGTISPVDSAADSLGSVTVRFKPAASYRLTGFSDNGNALKIKLSDTTYAIPSMTTAHVCSVFFWRQYVVHTSAGNGGTITPAPGDNVNDSTATVVVTATPNAGYRVDTVYDNGQPAATSSLGKYAAQTLTINSLDKDHDVRAVFKRYYTITSSASGNGTISPASPAYVDSGVDTSLILTPTTGYHVATLVVDTSHPALTNVVSFSKVDADHNVTATFSINQYTVALASDVDKSGSTPPRLCIYIPGPDSACTVYSKVGTFKHPSVTVNYNTAVIIKAPASWSPSGCDIRACPEAFNVWSWTTKAGAVSDTSNPMGVKAIRQDFDFMANYGATKF